MVDAQSIDQCVAFQGLVGLSDPIQGCCEMLQFGGAPLGAGRVGFAAPYPVTVNAMTGNRVVEVGQPGAVQGDLLLLELDGFGEPFRADVVGVVNAEPR